MPPTKAVLANLAKERAAKAEKQTQLSSESAIDNLWSSLQAANGHITELENELAEKNAEFNKLQAKLEKSTQQCSQLATDLSLWKSKHKLIYHDLQMQRQTSKRGQDKIASLNEQVDLLKKAEANASASLLKNSQNAQLAIESFTKANTNIQSDLSKSMAQWTLQLDKICLKLKDSQSKYIKLQKELTALQKSSSQFKAVKE